MKFKFTFPERLLIADIVHSMLEFGLLYGEELKDYVYGAAEIECASVRIRNYEAMENEIHRRIEKELKLRFPDDEDISPLPKAKPVYQIDPNTNEIIAEYKSVSEASKITGIHKDTVCRTCKGRYKLGGGYIWRYVNEIN